MEHPNAGLMRKAGELVIAGDFPGSSRSTQRTEA